MENFIYKHSQIQNMKKVFFFSALLFIVCSINVTGQNSFCQTPASSSNMAYNALASGTSNFGISQSQTLRVYFHVVNNGFSQSQVEQAFYILQQDFILFNIFFEWDCYIDYITAPPNANSDIFSVNNHQDGIDIYLYSGPNAGGAAEGVGESSAFYVSGNYWAYPYDILALSHVISHEMGHVLFLWHTHHQNEPGGCEEFVDESNCEVCGDFVCDTPSDPFIDGNVDSNCNWLGSGVDSHGHPYDPDTKNIMSYTTPSCMDKFSDEQGIRARNAISLLPFLADCKVISAPHEFFNNTTISWHQAFQNDLIIHEYITLTVTGSISMAQDKRIILKENAKLIVNGGIISNWCGEEWRGISVTGGNSDFDVRFTNSATIENTNSAAVSMFAPLPWPQIQQYGNGILKADNTTFNNTKRIVEFMAWQTLPNPSYIRDCVQNGGKWSITNWNCQGIDISNNVFNNITNECIITDGGFFTIKENEFNSGKIDILFNSASAGISSIIESNQFNGSNTGYNARGTTFAQNEILKNNFYTGLVGVFNDGHNHYRLQKNIITATYGSVSADNGSGIADVHNNDFSGNQVGTFVIGMNSDYNFYKNCYSTSSVDNFILGQVSSIISDEDFGPAHNCFTHSGFLSSSVQDLGGNPDPFIYIEPLHENDYPYDCEYALLAHPNVTRLPFDEGELPDCGPNSEGGVSEWSYSWPNKWDKDTVLLAYTWLTNKLNEVEISTSISEEQKERLTQFYLRSLRRVIGYLSEIYLNEGNYDDARDLYSEDTHGIDAIVFIFSSYIIENDLLSAKLYLDSINSDSEDLMDFIILQNINLNRLPFGPFYEVSNSEINIVKAIALKSHPYSAYGKALYYALTGEVISSQIPDIGSASMQLSSNIISEHTESLKIYPNPFSTVINVEMKGYEELNIEVIDILGRRVYLNASKQEKLEIPTNNWNQGLYFITIKSDGKIVGSEKLILGH